jgi:ABC-type multidrug transport system ATPase subunit
MKNSTILLVFINIHNKTNYKSTRFLYEYFKNGVENFCQQVLKEHQLRNVDKINTFSRKMKKRVFIIQGFVKVFWLWGLAC